MYRLSGFFRSFLIQPLSTNVPGDGSFERTSLEVSLRQGGLGLMFPKIVENFFPSKASIDFNRGFP